MKNRFSNDVSKMCARLEKIVRPSLEEDNFVRVAALDSLVMVLHGGRGRLTVHDMAWHGMAWHCIMPRSNGMAWHNRRQARQASAFIITSSRLEEMRVHKKSI